MTHDEAVCVITRLIPDYHRAGTLPTAADGSLLVDARSPAEQQRCVEDALALRAFWEAVDAIPDQHADLVSLAERVLAPDFAEQIGEAFLDTAEKALAEGASGSRAKYYADRLRLARKVRASLSVKARERVSALCAKYGRA